MSSAAKVTPARRQYLQIKRQYPDAILLYQIGDFYETFDEDAQVAARDLQITLTSREFGTGNRVPLAGIPCHALESYLGKLLAKGHKVAICQQVSEPGRGLVERAVVRVATPGTVVEPNLLPVKANNYLAAVVPGKTGFGLAYVDVSTGEFRATERQGAEAARALQDELQWLRPAECLLPRSAAAALARDFPHVGHATPWDDWHFAPETARDVLFGHFGVRSLEGFGCAALPLATGAAGAIVAYLERVNATALAGVGGLSSYRGDGFVQIDAAAWRSLELTETVRGRDSRGTLLSVLDATRTAPGGRALRRFLGQPLLSPGALNRRLDAVEELVEDARLRARLAGLLRRVADLERIAGRIAQGSAHPRDLLALRDTLLAVEALREALRAVRAADLCAGREEADPCRDLAELIGRAVAEEEGRLIKAGFDLRLDGLIAEVRRSRRHLAEMEAAERERTGIKSLRVRYNKVFGYYLEVSRANLGRVPPSYQRKQTVVGGERFTTPELKQHESVLLAAEERIAGLEREVYRDLLQTLRREAPRLLATGKAIGHLDVYLSLAEVAVARGYVRPELDESAGLEILDGRHPVVEANMPAETFVANDCRLGEGEGTLMMLTGPNMSGKSTYLRQVALIVLMAQIGSFVPARRARIGLVDRIFTRVGAQDNIAAGQSTFLVEMAETAAILRHATARSLVVLDEVGRGTGLGDGLAIARAVLEDLHDRVRARTLFATHFGDLAALAGELPGVRSCHVRVAAEDGELIFLHKIAPGVARESHGIAVARLAGVPPTVVQRAEVLRGSGEGREAVACREDGAVWGTRLHCPAQNGRSSRQLLLVGFERFAVSAEELLAELLSRDAQGLTPLEALARLAELQAMARLLRDPVRLGDG